MRKIENISRPNNTHSSKTVSLPDSTHEHAVVVPPPAARSCEKSNLMICKVHKQPQMALISSGRILLSRLTRDSCSHPSRVLSLLFLPPSRLVLAASPERIRLKMCLAAVSASRPPIVDSGADTGVPQGSALGLMLFVQHNR